MEPIVSVSAGGEPDPVDVHDRVINHIFGSGLVLARILRLRQVDDAIARELRGVLGELDTAVRHVRIAALGRALADDGAVRASSRRSLPDGWSRRLCRLSIDEVFAYAVAGERFYRASDQSLWAVERDGLLVSARSGSVLARRDGSVYCDVESGLPLYYEERRPG
jgi:hypothetical protein